MRNYNFQNTRHTAAAGRLEQCPEDGLPEIIMAGRSNVGKSSLINALCNSRSLARVSQNPGKTRLLLYFMVDRAFYLTDLPGYGYAKASKEAIRDFSALADSYLNSERNIALVLVLSDIRHGPSDQDIAMIDYLEHHDLPYLLVLSKSDKLSRAAENRRIEEITSDPSLPRDLPCLAVSSHKKKGLDELRRLITSAVNDCLDA